MVERRSRSSRCAPFLSGMLYDDAVIDPRDTRTVLGIVPVGDRPQPAPVKGGDGFGVFRM